MISNPKNSFGASRGANLVKERFFRDTLYDKMKHPEKSAFSFGAAFNQLNEFRATKMLEWLFTNQQSLAKENCSFQFDCFNVLRLCLENI